MDYINEAKRLRPLIEKAVQSLSDTEAVEAMALHPRWEPGMQLSAGQRVQRDGVLYTALFAHTAQADWMPGVSPSLFAKVLIPDKTEIPAWEQPASTNPYTKGDKVTHGGKVWVSEIDVNTWEPGVYGWKEVSE